MQITNNPLPIPTPKTASSKAQESGSAFPGQDAFLQRLQDIQENRDLKAAVAERNVQKGFTA